MTYLLIAQSFITKWYLRFNIYIQKCFLFRVVILIMRSRTSHSFWSWWNDLKYKKWISQERNTTYLFYEMKKFLNCASKTTYSKKLSFLSRGNFKRISWLLFLLKSSVNLWFGPLSLTVLEYWVEEWMKLSLLSLSLEYFMERK